MVVRSGLASIGWPAVVPALFVSKLCGFWVVSRVHTVSKISRKWLIGVLAAGLIGLALFV